jgi:DNA segregation ATPase FtsK/SpoIIIE, S-DNA-T family
VVQLGALVAAGVLGWVGRQQDRPIVTPATLTQAVRKLTADVVVRAFVSAGLCREDNPVTFPQPIQRDGRGWLAKVDLPFGRHYAQAAAKRESIASGLDVSPVTVFCDPAPESARRVLLWVSDVDVFAQKPIASPLVRAEVFDLWQPIPFGVDARDRPVTLPLVWSSLLVGAIPRMGKTYTARIPAAAAALDPHARLLVWDGKGGTDWDPFGQVAHVYAAGVRDTVVAHLVDTLRELAADMNRRYERLRELPRHLCPEAKVTPAITRNRRLGMPLVLVAIDEVQRYLEHPEHGKTILALLTDLAKVGPAVGIMLLLATQKPSSDVLPDDLRGQIGTRFTLKVMTWQASETILGAGSYRAGLDASRFLRAHKGVGILLGADDSELAEHGGQAVRTHLLDLAGLETICTRGRVLREQTGTLTGMAAGNWPYPTGPRGTCSTP